MSQEPEWRLRAGTLVYTWSEAGGDPEIIRMQAIQTATHGEWTLALKEAVAISQGNCVCVGPLHAAAAPALDGAGDLALLRGQPVRAGVPQCHCCAAWQY